MTTRLRRRSSFSRVSLEAEEEEKVVVPFPTQIKVEKKERKPILDLMEAIRQVKANAECNFDETVEAHVRLGIDAKRAVRTKFFRVNSALVSSFIFFCLYGVCIVES